MRMVQILGVIVISSPIFSSQFYSRKFTTKLRLAHAKRVFYTTKWPESNQRTNCIDCIFIAMLSIYSRIERMLNTNLLTFGWKIKRENTVKRNRNRGWKWEDCSCQYNAYGKWANNTHKFITSLLQGEFSKRVFTSGNNYHNNDDSPDRR